jgi:hypothetical protein
LELEYGDNPLGTKPHPPKTFDFIGYGRNAHVKFGILEKKSPFIPLAYRIPEKGVFSPHTFAIIPIHQFPFSFCTNCSPPIVESGILAKKKVRPLNIYIFHPFFGH